MGLLARCRSSYVMNYCTFDDVNDLFSSSCFARDSVSKSDEFR